MRAGAAFFVIVTGVTSAFAQTPPPTASTVPGAQPPPPPGTTSTGAAAPSTTAPPAAPAPPPGAQPPPYGYPYPYPYPYGYPYPYPPSPPPQPPPELPYTDGEAIPAGYHLESHARRGPIIAGSIMAGVTYGINLIAASDTTSHSDRATMLYIPGIGTWGYVAHDCGSSDQDESSLCSFLVLHSLAHSVGLVLIIYGVASPKQHLVRDDVALTVTPLLSRSTTGMSVVGRF